MPVTVGHMSEQTKTQSIQGKKDSEKWDSAHESILARPDLEMLQRVLHLVKENMNLGFHSLRR